MPVRIELRTPMLLRFRCNFLRLKDDLQLLNVPQTCASHGPSYRAHPRLYLRCRAGAWRMSRVQPLGEVNKPAIKMRFLAERTQFRRDRVVVPIARKHLLPDPLFFRCIFSGRSRGVNGTTRFVGLRQAVAAMSFRDEVFGTSEWAGGLQLRGTY